jgi:hypothetical protein
MGRFCLNTYRESHGVNELSRAREFIGYEKCLAAQRQREEQRRLAELEAVTVLQRIRRPHAAY